MPPLSTAGLLALWLLLTASPTAAQSRGEATPEARVEGAEAAYDEGVRAFEAGEFEAAGAAFERADELLPARVAMENAIRAYRQAGQGLRAATVATALVARDPRARGQGRFVPQVAQGAYRVTVRCDAPCELAVDGREERYRTFFLRASQAHHFEATFDTGTVERQSTGRAGQERTLAFERPAEIEADALAVVVPGVEPLETADEEAPAEPAEAEQDREQDQEHQEQEQEQEQESGFGVIPAWATLSMVGATAAVAGVAVWSGIDTLNAQAAYDLAPTLEGYEDGQAREARTNVLLGVAAGTAAVTAVMLIFTDWSFGAEEAEAGARDEDGAGTMTFGVGPMNDGLYASVSGSLP